MADNRASDEEYDLSRAHVLSTATSLFEEGFKILTDEATRVRKEKEAFDSMAKKLEHVHFAKVIELNVGGQHFVTSVETLTKDAGSMLNAMFSGRFDTKPSKEGSYFIDRDGTHFRYILNYLRTGKLLVPEDFTAGNELLAEAEFYQIQGIIEELNPKGFAKSAILSKKQGEILEQWIKDQSEHIPKFTLLFRASRDGWKASDFHSHCDYKGATVTIVKSGNNIFGGYADASWDDSDSYKTCTKAFLFSMVNPAGISPTKMELKTECTTYGISCQHDFGPTFGEGSDLTIANAAIANTDSYSDLGHTYECPQDQENTTFLTDDQYFTVNEYEVFGCQEG